MFKSVKIIVGIFSLLLFTEKVKADPFERAAAQNTCYYMEQGADYINAAKLAGMAQFSLLNPNLVVPGYIRRNMRIIASGFQNGQEADTFELIYGIMQNCLYLIEPYLGEDSRDLNYCLQDKEWCRKKLKM